MVIYIYLLTLSSLQKYTKDFFLILFVIIYDSTLPVFLCAFLSALRRRLIFSHKGNLAYPFHHTGSFKYNFCGQNVFLSSFFYCYGDINLRCNFILLIVLKKNLKYIIYHNLYFIVLSKPSELTMNIRRVFIEHIILS